MVSQKAFIAFLSCDRTYTRSVTVPNECRGLYQLLMAGGDDAVFVWRAFKHGKGTIKHEHARC